MLFHNIYEAYLREKEWIWIQIILDVTQETTTVNVILMLKYLSAIFKIFLQYQTVTPEVAANNPATALDKYWLTTETGGPCHC